MKQYIKTLAFGLLLGTALVSCNSNFDEGGTIVYPEHPELGIYTNDYVKEGDITYTVNLTLNEQGDTICDVTSYNGRTGIANTFSAGTVSYDQSVGMITADYEESPYECPARVVIAYKNDLEGLTVNLYSNDGKLQTKDYFDAVKTDAISYYGDWQLKDGSILSLNTDGTATITTTDGEVSEAGSYSVNGSSVTATVNGTSYAFTTNAQGQTYDSSNNYVQHILTQPKDDWYEYAVGEYSNWLFGYDRSGNAVTFECVLEYSPSRQQGRINGFTSYSTSSLSFYWTIGEEEVSMAESSYPSGYTYPNYGEVYAQPAAMDDGNIAYYKDGVFHFGMQYTIPDYAGTSPVFAADSEGTKATAEETFTITSLLE